MSRRGWLLFIAMGVIWGIPYLLIKVAVGDLHPTVLVLFRTAIGALLLVPWAASRGALRPLLPHWRAILIYTVVEVTLPWFLLSDVGVAVPTVTGVAVGRGLGVPVGTDRPRISRAAGGTTATAATDRERDSDGEGVTRALPDRSQRGAVGHDGPGLAVGLDRAMCAGCRAEFDHPAPREFGVREFDIFNALVWLARQLKTLALATLRAVERGAEFSEGR
jgi:hypothetical protein